MTAPHIYSEPVETPDLPVVPVTPELFDRIATTLGAGRVECDGERAWVAFNGRQYVTEAVTQ